MPEHGPKQFTSESSFTVSGRAGRLDDSDLSNLHFEPGDIGNILVIDGYYVITHKVSRNPVVVPLPDNISQVFGKKSPSVKDVLRAQGTVETILKMPEDIKKLISKMLGDEK